MLKCFKSLFKKNRKEEPVKEIYPFLAHIYTRNMGVLKIVGGYESAKDLADRISFLIDSFDSFTATLDIGNEVVIRSKDVEFVEVEEEPYEPENYDSENN